MASSHGNFSHKARQLRTKALLVRRVEYAEADLILTFFTREFGKVSALARNARKSGRRFSGTLEPFHTLQLELAEKPNSELYLLRETQIAVARPQLIQDLDIMRAAGQALNWIARTSPARLPEHEIWDLLESLLSRLDAPSTRLPYQHLAETGLAFLVYSGWGLELQRCVRCGKWCPDSQAACIDATQGGLVCQNCGGARLQLAGNQRRHLMLASRGNVDVLDTTEAVIALELIEQSLLAHTGI